MKNQGMLCLLAAACMFLTGITGFFIGQSSNPSEVIVSRLPEPTAAVSTAAEPTASTASPGPLDINTATAQQLDSLPGIGPVLAQRIVDYRNEHGPFSSISELTMVEGIGISILEKLMDYITTGGET